jgi:dCMP deaminase
MIEQKFNITPSGNFLIEKISWSVAPRPSWEKYALMLAKTAAIRSEDPYVKVGACALRHDKSVAALGYNGAPRGVEIDWSNREERRKRVIHAEMNCLSYCKPGEIEIFATTLLPCRSCMTVIAGYGIKKVVYGETYDKDDFALQLAKEFKMDLIQINI